MKTKTMIKAITFCLTALGSQSLHAQFIINTIIGSGVSGFSGDGGPATTADIHTPHGIFVSPSGEVYFSDINNYRIRKSTTSTLSGTITTVAGNGTAGFSGDGGPATAAQVNQVFDLIVDGSNNITFTDQNNNRVRTVSAAGVINTIAGTGISGFSGDGGQASAATFRKPTGIAQDGSGNLYIADQYNHRIRKITPAGIISTFAGTGTIGHTGDGGPATAATFSYPNFLSVDFSNNLLITDNGNHCIRAINLSTNVITAFAGTGAAGFSGDGGPATAATLQYPGGTSTDQSGTYIADNVNNRIRRVAGGTITTVVATGTAGFSGDGGPATAARISSPVDVATYRTAVVISDLGNNRIRKAGSPSQFKQARQSTGLPNANDEISISMTPNPNNGVFTIQYTSKDPSQGHAVITDISGRKMDDFMLEPNTTKNMSMNLEAGMYLLTIYNGSKESYVKFVVAK